MLSHSSKQGVTMSLLRLLVQPLDYTGWHSLNGVNFFKSKCCIERILASKTYSRSYISEGSITRSITEKSTGECFKSTPGPSWGENIFGLLPSFVVYHI